VGVSYERGTPVHPSRADAPSPDLKAGLHPGPHGGPRGGTAPHERGTPVKRHEPNPRPSSRANVTHVRQSRPDLAMACRLKDFQGVNLFPLRSEAASVRPSTYTPYLTVSGPGPGRARLGGKGLEGWESAQLGTKWLQRRTP
jgi:hypothetical protein